MSLQSLKSCVCCSATLPITASNEYVVMGSKKKTTRKSGGCRRLCLVLVLVLTVLLLFFSLFTVSFFKNHKQHVGIVNLRFTRTIVLTSTIRGIHSYQFRVTGVSEPENRVFSAYVYQHRAPLFRRLLPCLPIRPARFWSAVALGTRVVAVGSPSITSWLRSR